VLGTTGAMLSFWCLINFCYCYGIPRLPSDLFLNHTPQDRSAESEALLDGP